MEKDAFGVLYFGKNYKPGSVHLACAKLANHLSGFNFTVEIVAAYPLQKCE